MSIRKLQDFITPAEQNNSITTPSTLSRAEELECMIQKLKNSKTTHAEDASTQQLTGANIVASTESGDCLDHIFQLNIVRFLNQWLQEAAKSGDDDSINEQVINASLQTLEDIPLCQGKLNSSEIIVTIRELFGHKLVQIKQRLQTFFERWADTSLDRRAPQMAVGCTSDPTLELEELDVARPSQQFGVEWEIVDYTGRACNSFLELTSGELFCSERSGMGNFLLDLNIYPDSDGLDCELSLPPSNPLNLYAPVAASASNGPSELQFLPLNLECERSSRNSAVLLDSEQKENFGEINLNLEIVPPFMSTPSSSHWAPNLDLNLKSGSLVNGGNEEGTLLRAFMAESRNLLGEERKNLKRKEPDSGWDPCAFGYSPPLGLKL